MREKEEGGGEVKGEASPVILHGAGNFRKREFSLCPELRYPETITTSYVTVRINNSRQTTGESFCISRAHRGLPNNGRPNGTRFHARNYIGITRRIRGEEENASMLEAVKLRESIFLLFSGNDMYDMATYEVSVWENSFFFFGKVNSIRIRII